MKKSLSFLNFILLALMGFTITSCSSDEDAVSQQGNVSAIKLAKTPDISLYSGGTALFSTAATKAVVTEYGAFEYHKCADGDFPTAYISSKPSPITTASGEKNFVLEYIKEHPDEASVSFYNINYFIQYVGSSYDVYYMTDNNGAAHSVNGSYQMDYIEIDGNHINDYNAGNGPDALCLNLPLKNPAYHDSYGNVDNTKYNSYKIYKITYNGVEGYYLGFDYKTKKNSGEIVEGDGVFNDYVIKLTPADDTTYGNSDGGSGAGTGVSTTDSTGEVEVNLSVNAEKSTGDYIATKLSIHVRDTTDAEVFIPTPAEYYCAADDMAIVLSHKTGTVAYNVDNSTSVSYTIAGQTVTLTIAYENDGIRIKTSGINATVLKYLRDTYGDGLTFEVWNYYRSSITVGETTTAVTRDFLKSNYLDNSTVTFTTDPANYINAFGAIYDYTDKVYGLKDANGIWTPYTDEACTQELASTYWTRSADPRYYTLNSSKNAWDCTVTPTETTYTIKETKVYNQIYKK